MEKMSDRCYARKSKQNYNCLKTWLYVTVLEGLSDSVEHSLAMVQKGGRAP
uniref:Uncharacterized protein n=1 Tax=Arundo donax TaxID=35708 RepID=A0A0A9F5Z1_ARUDO